MDTVNPTGVCTCPKCGSTNIDNQLFQEQQGSVTTGRAQSRYKEKGHGLLWWLTIGWWWWIVDLFLWICFFFPRLLLRLGRGKKGGLKSTKVEATKNIITYRTVHLCKDCGHNWKNK